MLFQGLPSFTFPINFFTLKTMEVWIVVPFTGLKIREVIFLKQSSLAVLSVVLYMCARNPYIRYHSGDLSPPSFVFICSSQ